MNNGNLTNKKGQFWPSGNITGNHPTPVISCSGCCTLETHQAETTRVVVITTSPTNVPNFRLQTSPTNMHNFHLQTSPTNVHNFHLQTSMVWHERWTEDKSFSSVQRQKGMSSFVSSVIGGSLFDKVMGSAVTEFRWNLHLLSCSFWLLFL